jgi:hypothetical protein
LIGILAATSGVSAAFVDVVAFDIDLEVASGSILGVSFEIVSTQAVPRPIVGDNGGVVGAIIDGSSSAFNSAAFTPSVASTDAILLGGRSEFRLTFSEPLVDPTLHISQLQSNRLRFTSDGQPVQFELLSSDDDFSIHENDTAIQGSPGGNDDANGSLRFPGVFTELSWTVFVPDASMGVTDGYSLQISACATDGCTADFDNSGVVGFADLTQMLNAWGACAPGCGEDLNCDESVGFADLTELLNAWGPC